MMKWGGVFFREYDSFGLMEYKRQTLREEIRSLDAALLHRFSEDELVNQFKERYRAEVPVLEEDKIHVASHEEVQIDVRNDPQRIVFDRSRPVYVTGTETIIAVPFIGDPDMFRVRPSAFDSNPPQGELEGDQIFLRYRQANGNSEIIKAEYTRTVGQIKKYLGWLSNSFAEFNNQLEHTIRSEIQKRKQSLTASTDVLTGLGLPIKPITEQIRSHSAEEQVQQISPPMRKTTSQHKKWDIFISHATEDKDEIARPLADALDKAGFSIWYDEFSLKMGDSLRKSIDQGLAQSRYGIVILSKNFFAKHWPTQELNGLATKEVNGEKVILPVWHKVTFEDVRTFSPILADRVAVNSTVGLNELVRRVTEEVKS